MDTWEKIADGQASSDAATHVSVTSSLSVTSSVHAASDVRTKMTSGYTSFSVVDILSSRPETVTDTSSSAERKPGQLWPYFLILILKEQLEKLKFENIFVCFGRLFVYS